MSSVENTMIVDIKLYITVHQQNTFALSKLAHVRPLSLNPKFDLPIYYNNFVANSQQCFKLTQVQMVNVQFQELLVPHAIFESKRSERSPASRHYACARVRCKLNMNLIFFSNQ